jgi:cobyrinic acid a,c-diamide synthase
MSRATCREIFEHGSRGSDLSVVEGRFAAARSDVEKSSLESLADWLELPQIAVIDVSRLSDCQLPAMPKGVAGIVLDRVADAADGFRWRTSLEALFGVPVLAFLDEAPQLRPLISARDSGSPCRELCRALGDRVHRTLRVDRLMQIASSAPWSPAPQRLFVRPMTDDGLNIAVAFDDAFQGYFADTLDLLETRGARICDFSPLSSEALPWETDVVYIGGGKVEQFADALARNHCLKQSLRSFVAKGGRIYAEGGGMAYLCERVIAPGGKQFAMAGVLPGVAVFQPAASPQPVEITFGCDTWLGTLGTSLRGYTDKNWDILPGPCLSSFAAPPAASNLFVGTPRAIGSAIQVDFAGQPHLAASFFRPRLGALVGVE